jgi:hypothetical protein
MASDKEFVDFVVDQMGDAGLITFKKMFGEYALYCDGKVIALICDNQLFVKPTGKGRIYIGKPVEAPPKGHRQDAKYAKEWILEPLGDLGGFARNKCEPDTDSACDGAIWDWYLTHHTQNTP